MYMSYRRLYLKIFEDCLDQKGFDISIFFKASSFVKS